MTRDEIEAALGGVEDAAAATAPAKAAKAMPADKRRGKKVRAAVLDLHRNAHQLCHCRPCTLMMSMMAAKTKKRSRPRSRHMQRPSPRRRHINLLCYPLRLR